MAQKNYVGNGRTVKTSYGDMYNISLKLEDINKLPVNAFGEVKITVTKRKEADKYGNDLTVFENDYVKPEDLTSQKAEVFPVQDDNDLPF